MADKTLYLIQPDPSGFKPLASAEILGDGSELGSDGACRWQTTYQGSKAVNVCQNCQIGNNKVLVVGGYEHGVVMLKVEKKADGNYSVTELFKHNDFGDHTKPPIMYNGYFYAQFTTNSKRDGLVCMDMDGKVLWKTLRAPLFDKGSMILVDGVILASDGQNSLYVIEPSPSGFKPLASAEVLKTAGNSENVQTTSSRMGGAAHPKEVRN